MNKKILSKILVFGCLIGVSATSFNHLHALEEYTSVNEHVCLERKVKDYLFNTKGYKEEDILSIKNEIDSENGKWTSIVIFVDEPNGEYSYQYDDEGSVSQFSINRFAAKHREGRFLDSWVTPEMMQKYYNFAHGEHS